MPEMNMWRMGVPVATPITARDFLAAVSALLLREDHRFAFEEEARDFLSAQFVRSVNSGRAALFLVLQAMKRLSPRDEVVIPAYVCPSVGRAVVKAGLKPVLCDVGPGGSGLDLPSLGCVISRRTLATGQKDRPSKDRAIFVLAGCGKRVLESHKRPKTNRGRTWNQ